MHIVLAVVAPNFRFVVGALLTGAGAAFLVLGPGLPLGAGEQQVLTFLLTNHVALLERL